MPTLLFALLPLPVLAADLDTFRPSGSGVAGQGGFQVVSPTAGETGAAYGGLFATYAANPLLPEGDGLDPALRHLVGARLALGYTFGPAFRLDVDAPFYPWVGFSDADLSGVALGDVRAHGVVALVPGAGRGEGLALVPSVSLPTGATDRLVGAEGVGVGLGAAMGLRLARPLLLSANLGVDTGPRSDLEEAPFGSTLHAAAGLEWAATPTVALGVEVDTDVGLRDALVPADPDAVEAHAYAQFGPETGLAGTLGAGTAIVSGVGAPDLRLVAGLAWRFQGARPIRDTDRDGLVDDLDRCPDVAEDSDGHTDTDGCPDLDDDGDGLADAVDACREEPEDQDGYEDGDGCPEPDNDGDGVVDRADPCPRAAGPLETEGCPDQDGDRLADTTDRCPTTWGPASTQGCPDLDGDGITDALDLCPTDPAEPPSDGTPHTGCPALAQIRGDLIVVRDPVQFVAGVPRLDRIPNPSLDAVARVLNAHPEIRHLEIAVHTDTDGVRETNLAISQARAEVVVKYLITAGRVDPTRLVAVGYGDRSPIDSNETAAGRARNRRVEFRIR